MVKTKKIIVEIIIGLITVYNKCISPYMPATCRHMPTCSEYAKLSLKKYGPIKGLWLSICRLLRCQPLGTSGYDPIPEEEKRNHEQ
ncbi:MAG: membrane protein insertion efficiency factor YidD [Gammaproteobacteria bacterium]|nr:membrane protein insertion efficiency factor YidD [Gammaproteobacteria bacterium]|tara:strand:- start:137 stop:394 length:258 start_codon:yes stop_codon:yes gene_type:complete